MHPGHGLDLENIQVERNKEDPSSLELVYCECIYYVIQAKSDYFCTKWINALREAKEVASELYNEAKEKLKQRKRNEEEEKKEEIADSTIIELELSEGELLKRLAKYSSREESQVREEEAKAEGREGESGEKRREEKAKSKRMRQSQSSFFLSDTKNFEETKEKQNGNKVGKKLKSRNSKEETKSRRKSLESLESGGVDRNESGGVDRNESGGVDRNESGGMDRNESGGVDRNESGNGGFGRNIEAVNQSDKEISGRSQVKKEKEMSEYDEYDQQNLLELLQSADESLELQSPHLLIYHNNKTKSVSQQSNKQSQSKQLQKQNDERSGEQETIPNNTNKENDKKNENSPFSKSSIRYSGEIDSDKIPFSLQLIGLEERGNKEEKLDQLQVFDIFKMTLRCNGATNLLKNFIECSSLSSPPSSPKRNQN